MAVLNRVECRWASVTEPNTTYTPRWEIEAVLSDEQAAAFVDQGVKVKEDDDGNKVVRFKRTVSGTRKDGSTYHNTPPKVVDGNKKPFPEGTLIGNGSIVNIAYDLKEWNVAGNSGVKLDLKAVQVLELVEFSKGAVDEFDEEGETQIKERQTTTEEDIDDIF